jgi:hypothetical protein
VGIRVSTDAGWTGQFGVPVEGGEALAAFADAQATGVLDVVGIHAHRGGMLRSESELRSFLGSVLGLMDEIEQRLSLRLELMNLGGSLGTPTVDTILPRARRLNKHRIENYPCQTRMVASRSSVISMSSSAPSELIFGARGVRARGCSSSPGVRSPATLRCWSRAC